MSLLQLHRSVKKRMVIPLLASAMVLGCGCNGPSDSSREMSNILEQLDSTNAEVNRTEAVERLQRLGTNAFPFLLAEMNSFKWHTPQETDQAIIDRARRLREAFESFGTNLVPLTNEFARNLNTNRNFVSAMDGFVAMGDQGIPYLVDALTNRQAAIRLNAVAAILKVGRMNTGTANLAVPHLLPLLKDDSVLVRSLATEVLGLFCAHPDACIPALLEVVRADSDEVVRSQAVKAVGRIQTRAGRLDPNAQMVLEEISKQDKSQVVRRSAERVLAQENETGMTNGVPHKR